MRTAALNATDADTIVWGTDDTETIVWGTEGADTVVWGTTEGETIVWGTDDADTIVWGTTDADTIVWGTQDPRPSSGERTVTARRLSGALNCRADVLRARRLGPPVTATMSRQA